jgi:solute carrier family 25 carnitine/acylcarnitine transporter 20/29
MFSSFKFSPLPGFCNVFVGHPIDLIKVRQQCAPAASLVATATDATALTAGRVQQVIASESTFGMLRTVFVQEGVSGLYRGIAAPLLAVTPAFAVQFLSYDLVCRTIREYSNVDNAERLSISQTSLAGACSGVALATIVGPSERIKCLMQVNKGQYNGFNDCFRKVYQEGGLKSVFRGTGSAVMRDVPGNAAYFATYEFLKRTFCELEGRREASITATLLAGGFAGVANWIVAIPFDTIKTRWQTAPAGKYTGLADVFRTTVEKEGASALFRGLSPALLRAFPANAACLLGVETVRGLVADL